MPPAVPETPALYIEPRESFEFPALFFFPSNTPTLQIRKPRTGTVMCYAAQGITVFTNLPFWSSRGSYRNTNGATYELGKDRVRQEPGPESTFLDS